MNGTSGNWKVLCVGNPLDTLHKVNILRQSFDEEQQKAFGDIVLRTPYEFAEGLNPEKKNIKCGFSLRYIFAQGTVTQLDRFVYFCLSNSIPMRILNRRSIERNGRQELIASEVSHEEIKKFLAFCEGYILFHNDPDIPFIDLSEVHYKMGDIVRISDGLYAGQDARVIEDSANFSDNNLRVMLTWFTNIGLPVVIPKDSISVIRQAKHNNNRYLAYDEFFDYILSPQTQERLRNREFSNIDLAKALRMKTIIEASTISAERRSASAHNSRARREASDSLRLRLIKACALIVSSFILADKKLQSETKSVWDSLFLRVKNPNAYNQQTQALALIYPEN